LTCLRKASSTIPVSRSANQTPRSKSKNAAANPCGSLAQGAIRKQEMTPMVDTILTTLPPDAVIMQLLFGKQVTYSLAAIARLGVADHMGATPISVDTLAQKVGAHAPSLYRVMRMLAGVGVFREPPGRQFALTPVGELLRTDQTRSLRYMAMLFGDEWTTRAYEHFVDCVRTGGDGVTQAYGRHAFELLAQRADQAETFHRAMTNLRDCGSGDPGGLRLLWDWQLGGCRRRPRHTARRNFEAIPRDARCTASQKSLPPFRKSICGLRGPNSLRVRQLFRACA
jgi:hypothetical protein